MGFPKKYFEWRQLGTAPTWHLFFGIKSLCGRETSNGKFNFVEAKPPSTDKICRLCQKESLAFKERILLLI